MIFLDQSFDPGLRPKTKLSPFLNWYLQRFYQFNCSLALLYLNLDIRPSTIMIIPAIIMDPSSYYKSFVSRYTIVQLFLNPTSIIKLSIWIMFTIGLILKTKVTAAKITFWTFFMMRTGNVATRALPVTHYWPINALIFRFFRHAHVDIGISILRILDRWFHFWTKS